MFIGKVTEIFHSIQGEASYLGAPQIFVRLAGCNISCEYCDTSTEEFFDISVDELIEKVKSFNDKYHSVVFTGGEPLLQKDFLRAACSLLKKEGIKVFLETNGILFEALEEVIEFVDIISMDIKLPSSTKCAEFWSEHVKFLQLANRKEVFVKIVISSSTVVEELKKAIDSVASVSPGIMFVLQPVFEDKSVSTDYLQLMYNIAAEKLNNIRIIPQVHKFMNIR